MNCCFQNCENQASLAPVLKLYVPGKYQDTHQDEIVLHSILVCATCSNLMDVENVLNADREEQIAQFCESISGQRPDLKRTQLAFVPLNELDAVRDGRMSDGTNAKAITESVMEF